MANPYIAPTAVSGPLGVAAPQYLRWSWGRCCFALLSLGLAAMMVTFAGHHAEDFIIESQGWSGAWRAFPLWFRILHLLKTTSVLGVITLTFAVNRGRSGLLRGLVAAVLCVLLLTMWAWFLFRDPARFMGTAVGVTVVALETSAIIMMVPVLVLWARSIRLPFFQIVWTTLISITACCILTALSSTLLFDLEPRGILASAIWAAMMGLQLIYLLRPPFEPAHENSRATEAP